MMKKVFILILIVIGSFPQKVCAQDSIDVEVVLTSPADQAILYLGQQINMNFYIRNLGPDQIQAGDFLIFQFTGLQSPVQLTMSSTKNVNDTAQVSVSFTVNNAPPDPIEFCVAGIIARGTSVIPDGDTSNNYDCNTITFVDGTNSVATIEASLVGNTVSLDIYPNPAKNIVRIAPQAKMTGASTVVVSDITGRQVKVHSFGRDQNANDGLQLDVSTLTPGIYFVELSNGNIKARGKFLVQ